VRWGLKEAWNKDTADGQELDLRPTASDERASDREVRIHQDAGGKSGSRIESSRAYRGRSAARLGFVTEGGVIHLILQQKSAAGVVLTQVRKAKQ